VSLFNFYSARIGNRYLNLDLAYQKSIGALGAQNYHHPQKAASRSRCYKTQSNRGLFTAL